MYYKTVRTLQCAVVDTLTGKICQMFSGYHHKLLLSSNKKNIPKATSRIKPNKTYKKMAQTKTSGMLFCPMDGSLLLIEEDEDHSLRFLCRNCPYVLPVEKQLSRRRKLAAKARDDILGGDQAWEAAAQTDAVCPHCDHRRAYYMQLQTRSADEPMTVFYRCVQCKKRWKE